MLNVHRAVQILAINGVLLAATGTATAGTEQGCLLQELERAGEEVTVKQIRERCQSAISNSTAEQPKDVADEVIAAHDRAVLQPFTLIAHRPNYFLAGVYNSSGYGEEVYRQQFDDPSIGMDDVEAQFQLSVKVPLAIDLFNSKIDIYGAYTNRSFWQLYNNDRSSPFRDTNHEPELWMQWRPQWQLFGFSNSINALGLVHQSNGRGGSLSRSWNRVFANFVFSRDNLALSFKPWWRIPESDANDDNPDITDYLGHFQFGAAYKRNKHVFSAMLRNNFESGFSKGTTELSWSFPIPNYDYVKGYVQFFNGYGQSMIDYNRHANTIGIGLSVTDWL